MTSACPTAAALVSELTKWYLSTFLQAFKIVLELFLEPPVVFSAKLSRFSFFFGFSLLF